MTVALVEPEPLVVGQAVKCRLPGKRPFAAQILALRIEQQAVDVHDPRNGGRRTIRLEHIEIIKPKRTRKKNS